MALVLPWHLVLVLSGTMKGAVPGEMGDGDVADGEMGKDRGGGTPKLLLSDPHLQPLGWGDGTCPSQQASLRARGPSGRGIPGTLVQHSYLPVLGCPQSQDLR